MNSTRASPESSNARRHWQAVYSAKGAHAVSWFQPEPEISLALIEQLPLGSDAAILDVGGGASSLAARLIAHGFTDITVLDISSGALELARAELGTNASRVNWIEQDLLSWSPPRRYDLWHDRALFHFLLDPSDVERYTETMRSAISCGGQAIIATFAADGPESCSGLPVARYGPDQLTAVFGAAFTTVATRREEHRTPSGSLQPFTWVALDYIQA